MEKQLSYFSEMIRFVALLIAVVEANGMGLVCWDRVVGTVSMLVKCG